MIGPRSLFGNLKRALIEWLGLAIVTGIHVNPGKVINAFSGRRMVWAQDFLTGLECLFEERFRLYQFALTKVNRAQIILDVCSLWMLSAERLFADLQCAFIHRFSLREV